MTRAASALVRPGRNDPCPCGSGAKYKRCCGRGDAAPVPSAQAAELAAHRALAAAADGDFDSAARLASQAVAVDPGHPDALNVLAIHACRRRAFGEALEFADRALRRAPRSAQLHMNRGNVLRESGRPADAVAALREALRLDPALLPVWLNMGLALLEAGEEQEAADALERAAGGDPAGLAELAEHLRGERRFDAMALVLRRALERGDAADPALLNNLAMALLETGRADLAEDPLRRALARQPTLPLLHRNLGTVLLELGRLDEARDHAERALAGDPDSPEINALLGDVHAALRDAGAAGRHFARACELAPGDAITALRHGLMRLAAGDYPGGLPLLERRLEDARILPWAALGRMPRWQGTDPAGRDLLVVAEQGFGDALQFVRYVPMLAARGARVRLVVQPGLQRLFAPVPGILSLHALGGDLPAADAYVPMASLPLAFGTTAGTIPWDGPYLAAPPGGEPRWRQILGMDGRLSVGLCWAGNPEYGTDRRRSLRAEHLEPLAAVRHVRWVSLQKTPAGFEPARAPAGLAIEDHTRELVDFADTAGLVSALDLVISVDTSVAHLAGALGRPVWLLNRYDTDWRWGWEGSATPWYPSMRILRQPRPGDWTAVVAELADALETAGQGRGA